MKKAIIYYRKSTDRDEFTIDFVLPNLPKELNKKFNPSSRKYLYNTLVMCEYLMNIIIEDSCWKKRLDDLILKYNVDIKRMGFL